ncbi:MAG: hypothetical protein A3B99_00895 [Candidatus Yanofskybacteria bacterium RIFCSPHIGHO2_02_FULL_44_12b]|uniref:Glycosyl transferase family 9 n=2 Tax=Candidatus Zambryskiibacteriota TaxID=1817925 RepID=A0A1G2T1J5_9BACT|nr:MAG: hypothetical protein A3B99_00895 [Candidatus Yanofskybacteria bacterium RIFCSPHIGHO2_02_FULL_44_12b]OHA91135.1 MAG: hypothetical protein A2758_01505 [Candidatus Zambryskibacteria bacterium RIFCSPHIGHO2_01_FULL_49_18]OHB05173.1 MAG: hypothetical protein A3A26_02635 [Candidatus Zambryskibacteria bacterium RIFCSPLOWO2_01_FULL_47_14]
MNRLKRVILLVRSLLRAIFYGSADRVPSRISRIIVVPDGKLGDVVCATPVFAAVRKHFPSARIVAAGDVKFLSSILSDSTLVDEYVDLKGYPADAALLTGPSYEAAAKLYLAGVPLITAPLVGGGFSPLVTKPYRILTRFLKTYPYRMGEYAPREKLRCLEPLGVKEEDTTKHLGFSAEALKKVSKYFDGTFTVGLTPTAGHKIKEWPEERFAEVADYLVEKSYRVLIIGGPKDVEKVDKVISLIRNKANVVSVTDLNVDGLKALISKLNLFISVDTGPIYIAEAFNVPTIDITGPIDEREQPPRGKIHKWVVPKERKRPELFVLNAKSYDREEAKRQVNSITVSEVEDAIELLLQELR